jgi:hypothetical protein
MSNSPKDATQSKSQSERITYILVDFENVQPSNFNAFKNRPIRVKLFLGPTQSKIPVSLAASIQSMGKNVEYIMLAAAGKNALDFHIAYYAGQLLATDPIAALLIVSKDTGFDPLLSHLSAKGLDVRRVSALANMVSPKAAESIGSSESRITTVIADLVRRKAARPRTQKTLLSTIHALFKKKLSEEQASELLAELRTQGKVKINGTKVSYSL